MSEPTTAADLLAAEFHRERYRALTAGEEPDNDEPTRDELAWEEREAWQ